MQGMISAAGLAMVVAAASLQLTSTDFSAGGVIPRRDMAQECGGSNRSPQLSWSDAPKDTKSFALIVHDPDAPLPGGFYHWIVYNLPPASKGLSGGVRLGSDQLGRTSADATGYYGPCPPPGPAHHYVFTLYALDVAHVASGTPPTGPELERRIGAHILARTTLVGIAAHH